MHEKCIVWAFLHYQLKFYSLGMMFDNVFKLQLHWHRRNFDFFVFHRCSIVSLTNLKLIYLINWLLAHLWVKFFFLPCDHDIDQGNRWKILFASSNKGNKTVSISWVLLLVTCFSRTHGITIDSATKLRDKPENYLFGRKAAPVNCQKQYKCILPKQQTRPKFTWKKWSI